jgi:hypothetical protein
MDWLWPSCRGCPSFSMKTCMYLGKTKGEIWVRQAHTRVQLIQLPLYNR